MNNNLYMDLHILQTVPPSCVNRDDTGSPKTAVYGESMRARVSSQAWKRAVRVMFNDIFDEEKIGYRTKNIKELLIKKIAEKYQNISNDDIEKIATIALDKVQMKKGGDKKDVLFLISSLQIENLAELAVNYYFDETSEKEKEKQYKDKWENAINEKPSVDMLLFGRMSANNVNLNYDATVQVAHSISTHAVSNEYDYFTAVDDYNTNDNVGSGHLGTVEFNSSTLYRYATVNVSELYRIELTKEEIIDAVRGFAEAFIKSMPTGKQNTFANRTLPYLVYVTFREDQPINLVGSFERAVLRDGGYEKASIKALESYSDKVYANFASKPKISWVVCLDDVKLEAERVNIDELLENIEKEVSSYI